MSGGPFMPDGTPETSGNAKPAGFASPSVPARRSEILRNEPSVVGGHSRTPTLAHRFDGASERPRNAWTATPMKGLGAGDAPGLPRMGARPVTALSQPAPSAAATTTDATAGASARGPVAPTAAAPAVRPEEEDYSYTYLSPARHKYEFPNENTPGSEDWRYILSLGLRVSSALAVAYLIYHSEIGYLLGVTRRRRRGPGDGPDGVN